MKRKQLSLEQAFAAMAVFLERYHERSVRNGELSALLGDIQINRSDGRTMDPAAWDDWVAAVEHILKHRAGAAQG